MSATVETSSFLTIIRFFTPYGGSVGGFNTTSRVPYIAIPLSFDNTRKNLTGRNEIPKKSKIIAPYCPGMCVIEGGLEGESKYTRVQPLSIKDHGLMLPNLQFQGVQLHFLAECLPLKEKCVP